MGKATIFISGTVSQMPRYRDVQTKNGPRTQSQTELYDDDCPF